MPPVAVVPKRSWEPAPVAVPPIVELAAVPPAAFVPPVTVTPAASVAVALVPPEMVELVPAAAPVAAGADALKKATDGCNQVAVEIMLGN